MEVSRFDLVVVVADNCPKCGKCVVVTIVCSLKEFNPEIKFLCVDHGSWMNTIVTQNNNLNQDRFIR